MNKKVLYLIIVLTIILIIVLAFFYNYNINGRNSHQNESYISTRLSQELNSVDNNTAYNFAYENFNVDTNSISNTEVTENTTTQETTQSFETEIASFTTKIYSKDSDRQNNVSLACSALNDTIVENGSTFSFSETVGKATSSKGYKKADVFKNGKVIEALGGGLCQVSTTLYNAVLNVPNTKVTERHPHSNKVPYISSGKDAAVSYGTYDFKFENNTGNTLKIKASNTSNNVTIQIFKVFDNW